MIHRQQKDIMKQGTYLKAKQAFTMKIEGTRGKPVSVKIGDIFIVTSPEYNNKENVKIDRKNKAMLNLGYPMGVESVNQLFEVLE